MRRRRRLIQAPSPPTLLEIEHQAAEKARADGLMSTFDRYPPEVRRALVACPHYIELGRWRHGMNGPKVARLIASVVTVRDAVDLMNRMRRA